MPNVDRILENLDHRLNLFCKNIELTLGFTAVPRYRDRSGRELPVNHLMLPQTRPTQIRRGLEEVGHALYVRGNYNWRRVI